MSPLETISSAETEECYKFPKLGLDSCDDSDHLPTIKTTFCIGSISSGIY